MFSIVISQEMNHIYVLAMIWILRTDSAQLSTKVNFVVMVIMMQFLSDGTDNDKLKFIRFYGTNNATSAIISKAQMIGTNTIATLSESRSLVIFG